MCLEQDAFISAEPHAFCLIFNGKVPREQGSARGTAHLNTPPLRRNRRYAHPELAALLPPAGDILQARLPDRQRSSAGIREQHAKRLFAKQAAFWMEIEGIQSTEIINTLHDLTPGVSYLVSINKHPVKKQLIIWDRGGGTQELPLEMGTQGAGATGNGLKQRQRFFIPASQYSWQPIKVNHIVYNGFVALIEKAERLKYVQRFLCPAKIGIAKPLVRNMRSPEYRNGTRRLPVLFDGAQRAIVIMNVSIYTYFRAQPADFRDQRGLPIQHYRWNEESWRGIVCAQRVDDGM